MFTQPYLCFEPDNTPEKLKQETDNTAVKKDFKGHLKTPLTYGYFTLMM